MVRDLMMSRTVTVENPRAPVVVEPPLVLVLRTSLGRLFDELRRSALFDGVDEFERSIGAIADAQERNLALAWFYVHKVLTKDPEQILEISERFEEVIGPSFIELLGKVKRLDRDKRAVEAARRSLRSQAETAEASLRNIRAEIHALRGRIIGSIDRSSAANAALIAACDAAKAQMDALEGEIDRSHEVTVTQLRQWGEIREIFNRLRGQE